MSEVAKNILAKDPNFFQDAADNVLAIYLSNIDGYDEEWMYDRLSMLAKVMTGMD